MSRERIEAKLRPQQWFRDLTAWLDAEGIRWRIEPSPCGHPKIIMTSPDHRTVVRTIPCTPRQRIPSASYIAICRRALNEAGGAVAVQRDAGRRCVWTPERIACLTRGIDPLRVL